MKPIESIAARAAGVFATSVLLCSAQWCWAQSPAGTQPSERALPTGGEEAADQSTGENPLVPIAQDMQISQILVARSLFNDNTKNIQQQIVARLAVLIDQMQQTAQTSGEEQNGQQQGGAPSDGQGGPPSGEGGQNGASDSTPGQAGPNEDPAAAGGPADVQSLTRRVWGHLPPREREQMIQNMPEEFLPKYQRQIEQYYQRLAEEMSYLPQ